MTMRVVPWMADDAVNFMCNLLRRSQPRILEFGMGASTLFFAFHCSALVSFDHDEAWFNRVTAILKLQEIEHSRAYLAQRPYSNEIEAKVGGEKFDLISIDGRDRIACLVEILRLDLLAANGVFVIDNTERITGEGARYSRIPDLLAKDFNVIHFEQLGPDRAGWQAPHRWITSLAWRKSDIQYTTQGLKL